MRIKLLAAVTLFIFLIIGIILLKNKFGDIRPLILPPKPLPATSNTAPANLPLQVPQGYTISFYAQNLGGVRDLEFSPGGTLIASITSAGKVVALSKTDGKVAPKDVLSNLKNPHGVTFHNGKLYVAEETKVVRYNWNEKNLTASLDKVLFDLPVAGEHFTRSIVFDKSGKLYVSIGSTCNVCRENDPRYAAILETDNEDIPPKVFANGLRNSVFMAVNPTTNEVWATDMGRDFLGDKIPPDEINIIRSGKNYGWPICYDNRIHDSQFDKNVYKRDPCIDTEPPVFEIPAHNAPLGLTFINSTQFPADWQGDLLVSYHGSWNRSVPDGYKIVHMKVNGNQILSAENFITGFLQGSEAIGRPVDLIFDKAGNLYISDDKRGVVYIVSKK